MKEKKWDEFWTDYKEPSKSEKFLIDERDKIIKQAKRDAFGEKRIKILEVGCGYASNSRILNNSKEFDVYCVDSSKKAVDSLKSVIKNASIGDARKLDFKDNSFDIVFSSGLIEHFRNPSELTNEMIRVVKQSGLVITFVPGKYSLWQARIHVYGKKWQHGYEEPYTFQKLEKTFSSKSHKTIKQGGTDPFSINGILLKVFGFKLPIKKSLPNSYTEIYSIVKKL